MLAMNPAVEFRNVSVEFVDVHGRAMTAVNDVSLAIKPRTFTSIIGPSGCGKTTLLRLLTGLERASAGSTWYEGKEVRGINSDVGFITQDSNLYPWMTVRRNIEFPLELRGFPASDRRARSDRLIALIGLVGFEDHYPHQLSGGMQKRVSVVRTLSYDPSIVLMDEPFSALDAQTRMSLQNDLQHMWTEQGQTTILVTHDLTEAIALSDSIVIMSHRPGTIIKVFDVPLPRPRDIFGIQADPQFSHIYEEIWQPLRNEVFKARQARNDEQAQNDDKTGSDKTGETPPAVTPAPGVAKPADATPAPAAVPAAAPAPQKIVKPREKSAGVVMWRIAIVVGILATWEILSRLGIITPLVFSRPSAIAVRLWALLGGDPVQGFTIYDHIRVTFSEWAMGYLIGISIAGAAGFTLGRSRYLAQIIQPLILVFYGLPITAIAPLFLVIFGIGFQAKVATAVVITFFASFFQIYTGVSQIPEIQIQLARIMGASRLDITRRVILPASLPFVFTALRVAIPLAMTGTIIGEFVSSSAGLGYFILQSSATLDSQNLFATLLILMLLVYGAGQIVRVIEVRALRWQPRAGGSVPRPAA